MNSKKTRDGDDSRIRDLNERLSKMVQNEGKLEGQIKDLEDINQDLQKRIVELEKQIGESEAIIALGEILFALEWHLTLKYMDQDVRMTVGDLDQEMEPSDKERVTKLMNELQWIPFMSKHNKIHFGQLRSAVNSMKEFRFKTAHLPNEKRKEYSELTPDAFAEPKRIGVAVKRGQIRQIIKLVYSLKDNRELFEPIKKQTP